MSKWANHQGLITANEVPIFGGRTIGIQDGRVICYWTLKEQFIKHVARVNCQLLLPAVAPLISYMPSLSEVAEPSGPMAYKRFLPGLQRWIAGDLGSWTQSSKGGQGSEVGEVLQIF